MASDSKKEGDYFKSPGALVSGLIYFGVALTTVAAKAPEYVPYAFLGPLGTLTKYLVEEKPEVMQQIFFWMWFAHAVEAAVAWYLARKKNLDSGTAVKWGLQTFILGIFSLRFILAYKPEKRMKKH